MLRLSGDGFCKLRSAVCFCFVLREEDEEVGEKVNYEAQELNEEQEQKELTPKMLHLLP